MLLRGAYLATMFLLLVACGNVSNVSTAAMMVSEKPEVVTATTKGDPETGRAIFHGEMKIDGVVPCGFCHYIESPHHSLVGPDMKGIARRAATRVPGMSAEEYLRQSIREPDAYVVEGLPPGTMYHKYDSMLMDEHIEDLVAYLMTL
ncbi:MAG: c-type cytochrome [Chloroflexaceae bacterium]|nr:c-type cytochrome [Chloroflexaceae bacterium]